MANTTIVSTTTTVTFTLADKNVEHASKVTFRKENILSISLLDDRITVQTRTNEYVFSDHLTPSVNIVDSVNGVKPASLIDLYNKLDSLL